ncbi:Asp-tRNA(Asn)/Glu-tRNA(Gln) amidotransferase subunit GatA [Listeria fleischmannii]|uniref:Glutamyl-tRNA(Gln) amidotransferase subunit A n=1 Tax=Listeria fleischmannii TaxID=1069827 RepID=A0A841YH57_9LIST|nr:Asp-tRNA(Asn)/Glu-tRNA(Gln) amidotransferase subunit GatA [Listeria fleischmannii]MBC1399428.1 Asp-tRNA(Asn)/Glu-tRNA(Gln) amidotransferase subunit GatA [Listeria fleischmannii]MBC1419255.1 Asp-tRNA(Asn)/Glu-tRNA(Gln) amidotransferase subunit GatA [Listeria fleischmannii]MBC1427844.1 Asp-tRNA(Asn)/Glu-tRNA(Gln) amidotransferase subunit GatA [Listeria fleischmannii]STY46627.1 Glutamyl-tRNA(Gln) amidotransferase subunit A [Listeria fleischmannii subsp. coloradonensis]
MGLFEHSVKNLHDKLVKKEISPFDLVKESFDRIDAVEDKVQSFITLNKETALDIAEELGDSGIDPKNMLAGLPIAVKDNIVTKNLRTTAASKILYNFDPIYDATVIQKLKQAQVINIGKLNMDEFAMGSSTETSHFHKTYNPWDLSKVPGGSSGGSAASVAASEVLFSLGSDTGGSIRQPAAFCGVVGMKPTYGRISRFGLIAFASSLDQIGPITRTVEDNAYLLQAISGVDENDSTSIDAPVEDFSKYLTGDVKGLKIGVPKEYLGEGVQPGVKTAVMEALKTLEKLGATWEEVSLPHSEYGVASYYILASSEASSNLARFDGVRYGYRTENANSLEELYKKTRSEGFGDEVKRRIMLGTYSLSSGYYDAYYKKAQQARTLIKQDFEKVFENYDVIIGPSTPTTAFDIDGMIHDPITMYQNDLLTIPINLAGLPAISVPCGLSEGLPVGLQIIGNHFKEGQIYQVAHAFEQATDFHKRKPSL